MIIRLGYDVEADSYLVNTDNMDYCRYYKSREENQDVLEIQMNGSQKSLEFRGRDAREFWNKIKSDVNYR